MNLLQYHTLAVSEGNHPHSKNLAKYNFVSTTDENFNLVIRVNMTLDSQMLFQASFHLYNKDGGRIERKATVRLADGSVLAQIGSDKQWGHCVDDVRSFAEKNFELIDENGVVIDMKPKSSKPSAIATLGFDVQTGIACLG
jgi:hypothetical protein